MSRKQGEHLLKAFLFVETGKTGAHSLSTGFRFASYLKFIYLLFIFSFKILAWNVDHLECFLQLLEVVFFIFFW